MNLPLRLAQSVIPKRLHWFFHLKHSEIHGRARWMNGRETQAFLSAGHDGLAFGFGRRLSREESCKNLALIAPTGSGKTTRYVIPNLLQLAGSAVVTDPSGEIYRATSGHLARQGFRIQVLQPAEVERSLRFNPLACFRSEQELRRLAACSAKAARASRSGRSARPTSSRSCCGARASGNPRYREPRQCPLAVEPHRCRASGCAGSWRHTWTSSALPSSRPSSPRTKRSSPRS